MKVTVITAALLAAMSSSAFAGKTPTLAPVDFSSCMNTQADYGQPRGTSTGNAGSYRSALSFSLADPTGGNNIWRGSAAGDKLVVNVSVKSPKAVYTLLNTWWGQADVPNAVVTLKFASGRHKTFKLIGNDGIRDYNNFDYTDAVNGTTTQVWWISADQTTRLDVQAFNLGKRYVGDTLKRIILSAPSGTSPGTMEPILFAIGIDAGVATVRAQCSSDVSF